MSVMNFNKISFLPTILWVLSSFFLFSCESEDSGRDDATLRFFLRGKQYLEQKNYDQALRFFSEAVKADSTFAEAYNNRGIAWFGNYDFERAVKDYNTAISIYEDSSVYVDAYYNKANALYELKRFQEVVNVLDTVLQFYSDSSYVYLNRGTAFQQLNQLDLAIQDFEKAIELDPNNIDAEVNLGTTFYLQGDTTKAIAKLQSLLEVAPERHEALNTLGQIANERGQYTKALDLFNRALDQFPAQPYYLNNRAFTKIQLQDSVGALKDLKSSLLYGRDNPWAFRNMGIYFLSQEKPEEAIQWLEKAKNANPNVEMVDDYLEEAKQLKNN